MPIYELYSVCPATEDMTFEDQFTDWGELVKYVEDNQVEFIHIKTIWPNNEMPF